MSSYFDNTLTIDRIEEQQSTPVLPEERFIFELIGFEKSAPDQWRAEGGIKWTFLVFSENGQPFVFQDEQYQFFRTTGLTRTGAPNFNVGTYANTWASALLGRDLGVDADFAIGDLHRKRMSAMVVWENQKSDPKKKTIKLASLRHVPVTATGSSARPAADQVSADPTDDDIERALAVTKIKKSLAELKMLDEASGARAQEAVDKFDLDTASVEALIALSARISKAISTALGD